MTQTYKERVGNLLDARGLNTDGILYVKWIDAHDLAAEADASLASKDAEIARLREENERLERGHRTLTEVIHNHCLAMSAAVIEMRIGKGAQSGMAWIENTLAGPGLYPDIDEAAALGGAQAWFDAKSEEEAQRIAAIDADLAARKKG